MYPSLGIHGTVVKKPTINWEKREAGPRVRGRKKGRGCNEEHACIFRTVRRNRRETEHGSGEWVGARCVMRGGAARRRAATSAAQFVDERGAVCS